MAEQGKGKERGQEWGGAGQDQGEAMVAGANRMREAWVEDVAQAD